MNSIEATRETLDLVHQYVEAAAADTPPEAMVKVFPNSTLGSIASIYFHALNSEDWAIQELIQKKQKLFDAEKWYEKLGVPAPASGQEIDWLTANVPLSALQEYAQRVYRATDEWLGASTEADLDQQIPWHSGSTRSAGWVLADVIHAHLPFHAGEIAAIKGMLGLKGLPW
jgi:hypothetical protein